MKKISLFATGLLCAMAGGTSCSDDYAVPDYSRPASNTIAFSCQSAWGEDNRTLWTEESRIGFFCGQTNSSNVALGAAAISVGEPLGLFYTKLPWAAGEHTFYLYMPYDEANASTRLTGSLGATQFQNGVSAAHIAQSSLAYAAVTSVETGKPRRRDAPSCFRLPRPGGDDCEMAGLVGGVRRRDEQVRNDPGGRLYVRYAHRETRLHGQ